jgi:hypothetical protein
LLCCCSWGQSHCSKYCIIVQFQCIQQPCPAAVPAALPGSLARQPCPAALPQQPCPAAPCPAALPGSLARQPCPAALPRQPCSAALFGSLSWQFDQFRPDLMRSLARSAVTALYYSAVAGHQTASVRCCPDGFKLVFSPISPCFHYVSPNACARCCTDRFKLVFSPISPCFHYFHARAAVQQTGLNLFSCSYADLFAP